MDHLADRLERQLKDAEGVTEELKAEKPMEWVRLFNNIRNRVDEIILNELIYVIVEEQEFAQNKESNPSSETEKEAGNDSDEFMNVPDDEEIPFH